jgi:hypothetical protein
MTGRALIRYSPWSNFWPWEMHYCLLVGMNTEIECTYVYMNDDFPPREYTHFAAVECEPEPPEPTRHQFRP